MEIIPIGSDADDQIAKWKRKYNPSIFTKIPFTACLYGSSGTGKSTMVANILIRNFDNILDVFQPKNIHIYAKNGLSDVNFRALMHVLRKKDPEWNQFNSELDLVQIKSLIEKNRELFDTDPKQRLMLKHQHLLIIDDQIMNKEVHSRNTSGNIVELAVQGRHQCISTFILIQNITSLNPIVRRNVSYVFAFRLNSQQERERLYQDISHGTLTKKIVAQIYEFAISDTQTSDGQGIGFLTYRPYISDLNKAFYSSLKREIVFKSQ